MNCELNPTEVLDTYWLHERLVSKKLEINNPGKWMLFYNKETFDEKWNHIKRLFRENSLNGVFAMKCSTGLDNPRASDKNTGVIILYCNNSDNEEYIINIGKIIMNSTSYNKRMFYKTDNQTGEGTRATGSKSNHTYFIDYTFDVYAFESSDEDEDEDEDEDDLCLK